MLKLAVVRFNVLAQEVAMERIEHSIEWNPKDLPVGDTIGLLVSSSGSSYVSRNGIVVAEMHQELVPVSRPLYAVVDLLGSAQGVKLLPGALPKLHFSASLATDAISLSEDLCSVSSSDGEAGDSFGLAFCSSPLTFIDEKAYFEVMIEDTCTGNEDGFVLGVTTKLPSSVEYVPAMADVLPNSWSIGYDGQACWYEGDASEMTPVDWNPRDLEVGDRVGFLIDSRGDVVVSVNGEEVTDLPGGVTVNKPLFAFVNLLGNTRAVRIISDALPPTDKPGASNPNEKSLVFDPDRIGPDVTVSGDCLTAFHSIESCEAESGVLFSAEPLHRFGFGALYFEVAVTAQRRDCDDGLVIGVTTDLPIFGEELPLVADEVPNSWTFGYDGMFIHALGLPELEEVQEGEETLSKDKAPTMIRFKSTTSAYFFRKSRISVAHHLREDMKAWEEEDEEDTKPSKSSSFFKFIGLG